MSEIIGKVATKGTIKGNLGAVFGKDGVDGKSAYEIALDNGFEGTEKEWLESLNGTDGTNGADGVDGIGIKSAEINEEGELVIGYTNDEETNLGLVRPADGTDGKDGADGLTPFINANGYWQIGETNTGIKAAGIDGTNGDKGDTGNSGVYLGTGDMPDDCNVQVDPDGEAVAVESIVEAVYEKARPELEKQTADIETALDNIIAIQEELLGVFTFKIDYYGLSKDTYKALEGMTWGEWMDSKYCDKLKFDVVGDNIVMDGYGFLVDDKGNYVLLTDIINKDIVYTGHDN